MLNTVKHQAVLCVVGGGIAGLAAAVTASRAGIRTLLMHERPMLGGNASSEVRMWVCGAHGFGEPGFVEELRLENRRRNPEANYSIWDMLLYEKAAFEPNLTLLLNCACLNAEMSQNRIVRIKGYQLTTQTFHSVEAEYFADCSGDSILAPLTGALHTRGREGQSVYGESFAPPESDGKTMGSSCLIQMSEDTRVHHFTAPAWAEKITPRQLNGRRPHPENRSENFWSLELGGDRDTISDAEAIRDDLLKLAFGMVDFVKNSSADYRNWQLDWVGFLPGKRESRRYLGDVVLTQSDIESGGRWPDSVAYGGWKMDNHPPAGFRHDGAPTEYRDAPSPYGLPYRALYSRNIGNLFFAGRNISVSHAAMSSTRVMATCALLGQAVGMAAAVGAREHLSPREIGARKIAELQQRLLAADVFIPGIVRTVPEITRSAALGGTGSGLENLRNGVDRALADKPNAWETVPGDWARYDFTEPVAGKIRVIFDSDLDRDHNDMRSCKPLNYPFLQVPATLAEDFDLEIVGTDGRRRMFREIRGQYLRVFEVELDEQVKSVILTIRKLRSPRARVFAFELA